MFRKPSSLSTTPTQPSLSPIQQCTYCTTHKPEVVFFVSMFSILPIHLPSAPSSPQAPLPKIQIISAHHMPSRHVLALHSAETRAKTNQRTRIHPSLSTPSFISHTHTHRRGAIQPFAFFTPSRLQVTNAHKFCTVLGNIQSEKSDWTSIRRQTLVMAVHHDNCSTTITQQANKNIHTFFLCFSLGFSFETTAKSDLPDPFAFPRLAVLHSHV